MMESACLRHTEIPHTTRAVFRFSIPFRSSQRGSTRTTRTIRRRTPRPRSEIDVSGGAARGAGGGVAREERRRAHRSNLLAKPGTVAVVTGQQVGLFSGPAYTIYKALTAVRLAEQLSEQGIPAVPIFWLATEDHDFAEVNQSFVFGAGPSAGQAECERQRRHPSVPWARLPIADPPVDRLRETSSRDFRTAKRCGDGGRILSRRVRRSARHSRRCSSACSPRRGLAVCRSSG